MPNYKGVRYVFGQLKGNRIFNPTNKLKPGDNVMQIYIDFTNGTSKNAMWDLKRKNAQRTLSNKYKIKSKISNNLLANRLNSLARNNKLNNELGQLYRQAGYGNISQAIANAKQRGSQNAAITAGKQAAAAAAARQRARNNLKTIYKINGPLNKKNIPANIQNKNKFKQLYEKAGYGNLNISAS